MDDLADDDLFLDAVGRIGDDPRARFAFYRRLSVLPQDVIREGEFDGHRPRIMLPAGLIEARR